MFKRTITTAFAILAVSAAPALSANLSPHQRLIGYAAISSAAVVAQMKCPGAKINFSQMIDLKRFARIREADEKRLLSHQKATFADITGQIEKIGTDAWCSAVKAVFSQDGKMPVLIWGNQ